MKRLFCLCCLLLWGCSAEPVETTVTEPYSLTSSSSLELQDQNFHHFLPS